MNIADGNTATMPMMKKKMLATYISLGLWVIAAGSKAANSMANSQANIQA